MKIYNSVSDALIVLQGCAHSCDWERWCAQYHRITSNPEQFVALEFRGAFLPTAEILLQFNFPAEIAAEIQGCCRHYLMQYEQGKNPSEIIQFCQNVVTSQNAGLQTRCLDLVELVCHRNLVFAHHIQKFSAWVEQHRCQTQHALISQALGETAGARAVRKI